jgi:hypothetical protein
MSSLTDFFNRDAYKPTYFLGDRVFGHWNNIPFIGSVGNDRGKDNILVHVDLPISIDKKSNNIIIVKHSDITPLKVFEDTLDEGTININKRKK